MKNQLSLSDVLYSVQENNEAVGITKQEALELFQEFKMFLLAKCKEGSKPYNQIYNADPCKMRDYGIFKRLVKGEEKVYYIAGQDYSEEIKLLKKCFK